MNEVLMTIKKISTLRDRLTLDVLLIKLFTTIQIFFTKIVRIPTFKVPNSKKKQGMQLTTKKKITTNHYPNLSLC
jgi:hypothetical protein